MSKTYYVDSERDDGASIQGILDACRGEEAEIIFRQGTYYLDRKLTLTKEHRNLTIRGQGEVRLNGGKRLKSWSRVEGTPAAERFDESARAHIYVCDLNQEGIRVPDEFHPRGFARQTRASHPEVFFDTEPMNLSQYPKGDGFLTITDVGGKMVESGWNVEGGRLEEGYYYRDQRPKQWQKSDHIWCLGYWAYDWGNSTERVAQLDPERQFIRNAPPYGNHYFKVGQRFRFYHILEEVNRPGDYYVDYDHGKVYIYPQTMEESSEIILSMLEEPLLAVDGSSRITVEGITFEMVRGEAVQCISATDVVFDHCCFRDIGNYAVGFAMGKGNRVLNSDIHDCGDGGVLMFGGNRLTLEEAGGQVENNHIYRIAKWTKCYNPAISLSGVGFTARHNLIHDCPHTAIMYWGNEIVIEDNEIYSAVLETGDAGAVYTGRDYTFRGNKVNHNYIHHLGGVGMGTMAIYNDDAVSGTEMCRNYFEEVSRAAFMGGGRDFVVKNNVFVKCYPAIGFDCRSADDHPVWRNAVENTLRERFYQIHAYPDQQLMSRYEQRICESEKDGTVNAMESEYIRRYPELAKIHECYENPVNGKTRIPGSAWIQGNVFCSKAGFRYRHDEKQGIYYEFGKPMDNPPPYLHSYINDPAWNLRLTWSARKGELHWIGNFTASPEDFADAMWGDLTVRPDSQAFEYGYVDGDFGSIGLEEEKRLANPPKVRTRITLARSRENAVSIGIRNMSAKPVSGTLKVYAPKGVVFTSETLDFTAEPYEEKEYLLEVMKSPGEFEMEVRSATPGVRPSRGIFIMDINGGSLRDEK
mgnify:CR=1 FL=1